MQKILDGEKLDFDDVSLISRKISTISSRDHIHLDVNIGNIFLTLPIVASPMKDVCDAKISNIIGENGGYSIIHRFSNIEDQINTYKESYKNTACSIGINNDYIERYLALCNIGCKYFCIDVANGACTAMKIAIETLLSKHNASFIVGNVMSKDGYQYLQGLPNVIAIRVGVAGGTACTTKNATAMYHPMISLIYECSQVKQHTRLIADGGINSVNRFCKAIAAGADMVMMGGVIAASSDSPAKIIKIAGKKYKIYSGSASYEVQKIYKTIPKYIEGATKHLDYNSQPLVEILNQYKEGLISSMSYSDSADIESYRKNVEWCILR